MNIVRRRRQLQQRNLRKRKNVSFRRLSFTDRDNVRQQEKDVVEGKTTFPREDRSLNDIVVHSEINFDSVFRDLQKRFPGQRLQALDEGAGFSSFSLSFEKEPVDFVRTDIRPAVRGQPMDQANQRVNIVDLAKRFGRNRFHFIISSFGGAYYSPVREKALYQIVSVLKPGGIAVVAAPIEKKRIAELERRFRVSIKYGFASKHSIFYGDGNTETNWVIITKKPLPKQRK